MKGKRLLGIALAISSLTLLLVAAATAAPSAQRGGTVVLDMTTDVDYIDPQLSYYGETWKLEATTACKLMNWPDKEGAAGAVATPEVASGLPLVSKDGNTYTFTIKPGFKFSNGKPVREELRRRDQPLRQPEDAVDRRAFLDIIKGAQAAVDGKAGSVSGVKARGNKLVDPADEGIARPARAACDALPTRRSTRRSRARSTPTGSTSTPRAGRTTSPPGRRAVRSRSSATRTTRAVARRTPTRSR